MSASWLSKIFRQKKRKHAPSPAPSKQSGPKEAEKRNPPPREATNQPDTATPIEKGLRYTGPPFEASAAEQKRSTPITRIIGLVILSLFLVVVLVLTVGIIYSPDFTVPWFSVHQSDTPLPVVNSPAQERIPIDISFKPYLTSPKNYSRQVIALKGFLKRAVPGNATSGVYTEYLTDDHGNDIHLVGLMYSQMALFPKKGVGTGLFLVNGTFKWFNNAQGPSISVIYMVPTNRSFTVRALPTTGTTTG
jgi:hypothetical protein